MDGNGSADGWRRTLRALRDEFARAAERLAAVGHCLSVCDAFSTREGMPPPLVMLNDDDGLPELVVPRIAFQCTDEHWQDGPLRWGAGLGLFTLPPSGRARGLGGYLPQHYGIAEHALGIYLHEFPTTTAGKQQRRRARELADRRNEGADGAYLALARRAWSVVQDLGDLPDVAGFVGSSVELSATHPAHRWTLMLYALAWQGRGGIVAPRIAWQILGASDEHGEPIPESVELECWCIDLAGSSDAAPDRPSQFYARLEPDLFAASMLAIDELLGEDVSAAIDGREASSAEGDLQPASWFEELSDGVLNPDMLRKAARRGRLTKSVQLQERGHWLHSVSEVRRIYPHYAPALQGKA